MGDEKKSCDRPSAADYEVGYRKPPKQSRFQPGQSGNPRGRPKGTKNLRTDLLEELGEKVVVREGEQARQISKQRAVVKTIVNGTLKGDPRIASLLMSLVTRLLDTGEGTPEISEPLHDDELEILRAFEDRVRQENHDSKESDVDRGDAMKDGS